MAREVRTLRLFVSIVPPPEVAAGLLGALHRHVDVSNARVVPPAQVHMTVQFIGETDVRDMARVRESVERSVAGLGAFVLHAERLIQLPERGRPGLVAAETDAPAPLTELHRRLAHRLARRARRDAGDRFRPHLTLCRYQRIGRVERLEHAIALGEEHAWRVEGVRLMSSVLRPEGAEHRVEMEVGV
jgi:2'-5' RNA ligase